MNCNAQSAHSYMKILSAANDCFRSQGFDETTVSDVCRLAQLSSDDFYAVFESLDDVLDVLWEGEVFPLLSDHRYQYGTHGKVNFGIVNHSYRSPDMKSTGRIRIM